MRKKRKYEAFTIQVMRAFGDLLQYFLVPKMHAIKSANRNNGLLTARK
jgi:uncharacterized protein YqcC (DUF446 family)